MENTDPRHQENPEKTPKPVETDYAHHEQDPGPSPQAVNEDNNNGAGPVMKWIIPIIIVVMLIYWFLIRK
ncbi:hypothetical protein [Pedobacter sp. MR2016-24]|uniref:hypothetical protein n=1 Tax=Pedobacter sp. MR2016-24 TaxID=2994466 RepID=UPI0022467A57|nr:hypothetical protein [Pedobacter sp. MR2016-24]MCX2485650.1 hypothetical protein [Pedobacter sp. MR2016-24]MDO7742966.1 hypothetical protein [Pedobacter sp.]